MKVEFTKGAAVVKGFKYDEMLQKRGVYQAANLNHNQNVRFISYGDGQNYVLISSNSYGAQPYKKGEYAAGWDDPECRFILSESVVTFKN